MRHALTKEDLSLLQYTFHTAHLDQQFLIMISLTLLNRDNRLNVFDIILRSARFLCGKNVGVLMGLAWLVLMRPRIQTCIAIRDSIRLWEEPRRLRHFPLAEDGQDQHII